MEEKKEMLGINQQNPFETTGKEALLNLTKVRVATKRNRSRNMKWKRRYYSEYYITMMTLI